MKWPPLSLSGNIHLPLWHIDGLARGLWVLGIIVVPWLGVLAYFVLRGDGMTERNTQALAEVEEAKRVYIQEVVGTSTADELAKLVEPRDKGIITDAELEAQKAKLLG